MHPKQALLKLLAMLLPAKGPFSLILWIPVGEDALKTQRQRKLKLNQLEFARMSGKTATPELNLVQMGRRVIKG
jgi:hypothetical protein